MPELPEVETMRRGIAGVRGGTIRGVFRAKCRLKPIELSPVLPRLRRRIIGRRVVAVDRVGKRVVWRLDDASCLVFEPRMTGNLLVELPVDRGHCRLIVELSGCATSQVIYWDRRGLGKVYWLSAAEAQQRLGSDYFGPDALIVTASMLRARMATIRRDIKVALLDQRLVAGIGNLYASEILHVAGIDPRARCDSLDANSWRRLHRAVQRVLNAAVRYEGSTLNDGTYRNSVSHPGSYQSQHRVYQRTGEACPTCRLGKIRRIVQAQRATFYCDRCQK